MKFFAFIIGIFVPFLLGYLLGNFITWGDHWNIANYQDETRLLIVLGTFFGRYLF